jgi:hypothetical protein
MMTFDTEPEAAMADRDWTAYTKQLLRAEMMRKGINYKGLVEKLAAIGVKDSEANLRNKISRGGFTGAFLIQCLVAMGVTSLRLED